LISYAALVALGAHLTLPGLAGFVLAIGMAIGASMLDVRASSKVGQPRVRDGPIFGPVTGPNPDLDTD
jgi:SecD/SecF fusion protein